MKITAVLAISLSCALYAAGCTNKSKDSFANSSRLSKNPVDSFGLKPAPCVMPADSSISPAQVAAWFACNPKLDSLSYRFADSFSTEKASPHTAVCERIFLTAQDSICVRNGLRCGLKEYRWITNNLGIQKNKAVYDSVRTSALKP